MKWDAIVVGGGLAGWIAAVLAARGGKRVLLAEKARGFGGRAATVDKGGVRLSLGAHALYREGELHAILEQLGALPEGGRPAPSGHSLLNGRLHPLPGTPVALAASRVLSWSGKLELARNMLALKRLDESRLPEGSFADWAERTVREPEVRHLLYALCRTSTYAHAPELQQAGPVLLQLKRSLTGGVLYVDNGWSAIVERLRRTAERTGRVTAASAKAAAAVTPLDAAGQTAAPDGAGGRFEVRFEDGETARADAVVLAVPPAECRRLVSGAESRSLELWNRQALPLTAACLDLGMRRLPDPRVQFVMGVDTPFLFTNQSRAAKLSDNGLLAVHLLRYHRPGVQPDAERDREELERTLDILQPGWRAETEVRQYLPRMTVVHGFAHTGRTEAPGPAVPELSGLYVAGDWAGGGELLADAAAASARRAAEALLREAPSGSGKGDPHNEQRGTGRQPAV